MIAFWWRYLRKFVTRKHETMAMNIMAILSSVFRRRAFSDFCSMQLFAFTDTWTEVESRLVLHLTKKTTKFSQTEQIACLWVRLAAKQLLVMTSNFFCMGGKARLQGFRLQQVWPHKNFYFLVRKCLCLVLCTRVIQSLVPQTNRVQSLPGPNLLQMGKADVWYLTNIFVIFEDLELWKFRQIMWKFCHARFNALQKNVVKPQFYMFVLHRACNSILNVIKSDVKEVVNHLHKEKRRHWAGYVYPI